MEEDTTPPAIPSRPVKGAAGVTSPPPTLGGLPQIPPRPSARARSKSPGTHRQNNTNAQHDQIYYQKSPHQYQSSLQDQRVSP